MLADGLQPDIILMDLSMPGVNGLEATRSILKAQSSVKVLMLTLYDSIECVESAFRAGVSWISIEVGYDVRVDSGAYCSR